VPERRRSRPVASAGFFAPSVVIPNKFVVQEDLWIGKIVDSGLVRRGKVEKILETDRSDLYFSPHL
jgi:hypothetical protein